VNQYFSGYDIKKNEMGGACSAYGRREKSIQGFSWGNLREREQWLDPGVDGRILTWIFSKWDVGYGLD
jgi:hypothetical protein